ncbi:glutathione S-transferase [Acetobacter tropicalis]|uniref:Glutathione S-transferase, subgroup n=1 Tax=Acetobacter tropicalis TaxID=104102 RepID=A0A094Z1E9_9PROT|nr:glutathione S-transferase [Acetobacter tropicalis]KAA8391010.1 glutathione S-transferase [Acetobacter tropicalis]KAA8392556.1 glutathione S-transferase [Acetobacter tropicalis]KGB26729.1 Glutathione S-transferase, subgroup [Acetobacter tropicalis]MBC9009150.1 glutathione S-transferase [Acetobacter tropicalis]MDO8171826.1 glutathione S-transferase [Acetobacter tropicalis]
MIILYGTLLSGHVHRVRLLLSILKLDYQFEAVSGPSSELLGMNPLGQIPILKDNGIILSDSNAIMVYLVKRYAPGSSLLPQDPVPAAHVQRWLSIATGELRQGPAAARMVCLFHKENEPANAKEQSHALFTFMNTHLGQQEFLATPHPTLADLACYAYTARAPEGGISLENYLHIQEWLKRIEALPGFVSMPWAKDVNPV